MKSLVLESGVAVTPGNDCKSALLDIANGTVHKLLEFVRAAIPWRQPRAEGLRTRGTAVGDRTDVQARKARNIVILCSFKTRTIIVSDLRPYQLHLF